jgi:formylglycine-generating enzyme required for sulfatase activity
MITPPQTQTPSLIPGEDPRLARLLRRLPDVGVPVLPLDYQRIALAMPAGHRLSWEATRELLVSLLAKDQTQRRLVRRLFRDYFPPEPETDAGSDQSLVPPSPNNAAGSRQTSERPRSGSRQTEAVRGKAKPIRTRPGQRLSIWWLALLLSALIVAVAWWMLSPPPETLDQPIILDDKTGQPMANAPDALPAIPIPRFHDWVAVMEPVAPAELIQAWLPPIALLVAALLGLGWLIERNHALRHPRFRRTELDPDAEPLLTWTENALRLPSQLDGAARRELIWGVQRFDSEQTTTSLDVPGTVQASAAGGLPSLRFEPLRYEREVWLWLDQRLTDPAAQALAEEIARRLERAGLRVRLGNFRGLPERIRYHNRERAEVRDLGDAARQALVAIFTDGISIGRALGRPDREPGLRRALRELAGWPRLCLVDYGTEEDDLPSLARQFHLTCIRPAWLPAWLAERQLPLLSRSLPGVDNGPSRAPSSAWLSRCWAAVCALPGLPPTLPQVRALADRLAIDPSALPIALAAETDPGRAAPSEAERRALLADLADWVWDDRRRQRNDQAERWLRLAIDFWHRQFAAAAEAHGELAEHAPEVKAWKQGRGDYEQTIERLLLDLWWGDLRTAGAVQGLWDLYQQTDQLAPLIRARLNELSSHWSGAQTAPGKDARIRLPWLWPSLPEAPRRPTGLHLPGWAIQRRPANAPEPEPARAAASIATATRGRPEPRGTARQRLLRMGFAGAKPGAKPRSAAETRWGIGLMLGLALAAAVGIGERIMHLSEGPILYDAKLYQGELFQQMAQVQTAGNLLYAASHKQVATRERLPGIGLHVHWCWTGQADQTLFAPCTEHASGKCLIHQRARRACEPLLRDRDDPRRINPVRLGDSLLLRAGTLAEPIRACTPPPEAPWPAASIAVIAGDPWDWPEADDRQAGEGATPAPLAQPWHRRPERNRAALQLAIRLLDSGAVDLALIGPVKLPEADRTLAQLAQRWAFRSQSQWLFFSPPGRSGHASIPSLGKHRAHITADYAALARHLRRARVQGALQLAEPTALPARLAQVEVLAGQPRLWAGPAYQADDQGIDWVRICPGTFTMGSAPADSGTPEHVRPFDDELPAHPVLIHGFDIARTELTRGQVARMLGQPIPAANQGQMPADDIDWKSARELCRALGADLPTESQWEYAARGGDQNPYPFASELETLCRYANGADSDYNSAFDSSLGNSACSDGHAGSAPVGRFPANPAGLYDMHGNLLEWTLDCWDAERYGKRGRDPVADPSGQRGDCGRRVLRGGSFDLQPRYLRSADRRRNQPEGRDEGIGFRCVRGSVRQRTLMR